MKTRPPTRVTLPCAGHRSRGAAARRRSLPRCGASSRVRQLRVPRHPAGRLGAGGGALTGPAVGSTWWARRAVIPWRSSAWSAGRLAGATGRRARPGAAAPRIDRQASRAYLALARRDTRPRSRRSMRCRTRCVGCMPGPAHEGQLLAARGRDREAAQVLDECAVDPHLDRPGDSSSSSAPASPSASAR